MTDKVYLEYWPLSELLEAPVNPKEHDLPGIGASMRRFGYTDPMMIDERTGRLVRGHGRREELLSMKQTESKPPLRVQVRDDGEWLIPVVRGVSFNSDDEALAYSLADNKLTEKGGWNTQMLADVLSGLTERGGDDALKGTGFNDVDLAKLGQLVEIDPNDLWKEMPEFEQNDLEFEQEITVRFMARDDVKLFAEIIGQTVTEKTKSIWFPKQEFDQHGTKAGVVYSSEE